MASPERDRLIGEAWFALGAGRFQLGDHEESLAAYLRSLRGWQALGLRTQVGQTHYAMAAPQLALRRYDEAYSELLRALKTAHEDSDSVSLIQIGQQLGAVQELIRQAGQQLPPIPEELRAVLELVEGLEAARD